MSISGNRARLLGWLVLICCASCAKPSETIKLEEHFNPSSTWIAVVSREFSGAGFGTDYSIDTVTLIDPRNNRAGRGDLVVSAESGLPFVFEKKVTWLGDSRLKVSIGTTVKILAQQELVNGISITYDYEK
jgi:hypothetical protein